MVGYVNGRDWNESSGLFFCVFKFATRCESLNMLIEGRIGIAVGFATFENVCYLTENGAADFYDILIRGVSAGSLHLLCGIALSCGIAYVFRKKWIMVTGTIGALGACVVFHGIYNILITAKGRWNLIGYLFPIFLIFALLVVKKSQFYKKIEFE